MEYIPDYLKPFIIHKDYFPELIEDSWFNNPVYWKGRLISPQHETKFRLYFCGELIDNYMANKQNFPLAAKNGADCYSKNGDAVTVLTWQS